MKFKHAFNVFIDNFSVIYKQLLYRLVVDLIAIGLCAAVIIPFYRGLTGTEDFKNLMEAITAFFNNIVGGNTNEDTLAQITNSVNNLLALIWNNRAYIAWGIVGVVLINLVKSFFLGLGNYAAATVINDRMALHAKSPFMATLIRNLKDAALYSVMYVPISFVYDLICYLGLYLIVFLLLSFLPLLIQIFIYVTAMVIAISFKMVFTTDWLPSLIRGKKGHGNSFVYALNRKGKGTLNVFSNFVVLSLIIFAVNVMSVICTFGTAGLLTIPSSYVILLCFEFVNYYDREELKYFIDKNTIIKPEKERPVTREEFFRGE